MFADLASEKHDAAKAGIQHWEDNTCLRFKERTTEDISDLSTFIRFTDGSGCSSTVGKSSVRNTLTLDDGCTRVGLID